MKNKVLAFLVQWWIIFFIVIVVPTGIGIHWWQMRPQVLGVIEVEISAIPEGLIYEFWETPDSSWVVVTVDEIPSETLLKAIAFVVWKNTKTPCVFLYLPEMKTSGPAYGVAKFIPRGLKEFKINPSALRGTKWEER